MKFKTPFRKFDVPTEDILFMSTNWNWGGAEELWSRTALKLAREGLDVIAVVAPEGPDTVRVLREPR